MADIVVTPSSPLNLVQPQQTFTDTVVIEGGQVIAQGIQVSVMPWLTIFPAALGYMPGRRRYERTLALLRSMIDPPPR